jgi:two-component system chemotaxis sensor kinase CheA
VLARNQILQYRRPAANDRIPRQLPQRLNLITTELQESVMKTRMQPIGNIWAKFPRIVRDLAANCGKKIQLVMEGNETELDRTIIEAIKDPAHPHRPQRRRPRHRAPEPPRRRRQARRGHA